MRKFKWAAVAAVTIISAVSIISCGKEKSGSANENKVKIGVVGESNEMWTPVIKELKDEGIEIELVSFTDYATPNAALDRGEIDLNAFQHHAYFNKDKENNGYKIEAIGDTFISAMNIYSKKIKDVKEVKDGDKVAIPNDATNQGRALKILSAAGLIKVDEKAGDSPEVSNIVENPHNLQLVEVDAGNVYALLPDVAIAVINCNYAIDNGLNPGKDSIFQDSPEIYKGDSYHNLIAAKAENVDNEVYKKVVKAYQSDAVKEIYKDAFKGSYIPAWEKK